MNGSFLIAIVLCTHKKKKRFQKSQVLFFSFSFRFYKHVKLIVSIFHMQPFINSILFPAHIPEVSIYKRQLSRNCSKKSKSLLVKYTSNKYSANSFEDDLLKSMKIGWKIINLIIKEKKKKIIFNNGIFTSIFKCSCNLHPKFPQLADQVVLSSRMYHRILIQVDTLDTQLFSQLIELSLQLSSSRLYINHSNSNFRRLSEIATYFHH